MSDGYCQAPFRNTACFGTQQEITVGQFGETIEMCAGHAGVFVMLMQLSNLYGPDQLNEMSVEEITEAWHTAFGVNDDK